VVTNTDQQSKLENLNINQILTVKNIDDDQNQEDFWSVTHTFDADCPIEYHSFDDDF
jgi:acetyl-CoA synthetase